MVNNDQYVGEEDLLSIRRVHELFLFWNFLSLSIIWWGAFDETRLLSKLAMITSFMWMYSLVLASILSAHLLCFSAVTSSLFVLFCCVWIVLICVVQHVLIWNASLSADHCGRDKKMNESILLILLMVRMTQIMNWIFFVQFLHF